MPTDHAISAGSARVYPAERRKSVRVGVLRDFLVQRMTLEALDVTRDPTA